jgi:hypothetical protein
MKTKAQNFILAGQHTSTDVFMDYNPDTSITAVVNGSAAVLSLDMNLDGTEDFLLHASVGANPFGGNNNIKIIALGQNAVAYEYTDSCVNGVGTLLYTRAMAKSFPMAYYLGAANYWLNDTVHLHYDTYSTPGSACSSSVNIDYVGVKVISGADTLYGWIKLSYSNFGNITVQEFASNVGPLSSLNEGNHGSTKISPNPANDFLHIIMDDNDDFAEIRILDAMGHLIQEELVLDRKTFPIDVSEWPDGFYLIRLKNKEGEIRNYKVVVHH